MFAKLILTITGVVVLAAVFEMLLPDSANKKYLKGAMALIFCYVLLSSLAAEFNLDGLFKSDVTLDDDTSFLEFVQKVKEEKIRNDLIFHLQNNGFSNLSVNLSCKNEDNLIFVEKVTVDKKNVVIKDTGANINISDKLKTLVSAYLNIEKEKVFVYG